MKRARRVYGFTLIELLTVLAVISVLTTIGVSLFFRVGDRIYARRRAPAR